ncbi:hypothetical protein BYT27DRAFT_7197746 [Phlegmacium glaucopus]|nr:hypothetical protein BYT27DRAFT_7197746 [Phlegmacium glaucopus]
MVYITSTANYMVKINAAQIQFAICHSDSLTTTGRPLDMYPRLPQNFKIFDCICLHVGLLISATPLCGGIYANGGMISTLGRCHA